MRCCLASALLSLAVVVLSGCATQRPITVSAQWNPEHARKLLEPGANTIRGSAAIQQNGGGVVTCAGRPVTLIPATDYATERIQKLYGTGLDAAMMLSNPRRPQVTPEFTEYYTLRRETLCDTQGYFTFENVADGAFYVTTAIVWTVGYSQQGGALMHRVETSGGRTSTIVLSPFAGQTLGARSLTPAAPSRPATPAATAPVAPPVPAGVAASPQSAAAAASSPAPVVTVTTSPRVESDSTPRPARAAVPAQQPVAQARPVAPAVPAGYAPKYTYQAFGLPEVRACPFEPEVSLAAVSPGVEVYSARCHNAEPLMLRCEWGACRVLR